MALNYHFGKTEEELLALLATLQRERDSLVVSASAGDSSVTKHRDQAKVEKSIEQVFHALYLLDPETYTYSQMHRIKSTKAYFSSTPT